MSATKNEMAPHIRKTVAEIDGDIMQLHTDIERLKTTRATLVQLYGGETELPDPEIPAGGGYAKTAAKPAKVSKRVEEDTAAPARKGAAPSVDTIKLMACARTAPEPFTAASLHVASGFDVKFCSNKLWAWKQHGFITKTGPGEFTRSATFPATAPNE